MRSVNLLSVFVILSVQGVFSQTCPPCPDRFASDGVTPCTKIIGTDPCSCSYTCVSRPKCDFKRDEAICKGREINGLACRFTIVDPTRCQTSCSCSSTSSSPGSCDFTGPRADCLKKDPNCKFNIISNTNCQSSCSCPVVLAPCDFAPARAKCATAGCTLSILDSTRGRCHSQCNCIQSSNNTVCDTSRFAYYQSECVAKGCTFEADPYNCKTQCKCSSETTAQVPASCDEAYYQNKCLSTKDATCTFKRLSLTDCRLDCTCVSNTGTVVPGQCDLKYYENICLTTPGATCEFVSAANSCSVGCYCRKN